MKTLAMLVLGLTLFACGAVAQERIDESRPARPGGTVEIHNLAGSVRVTGWNRNEVQVTGTLGRGTERLEFTSEGDRTQIRVILPRNGRNVQGSDLEIRIPAESNPTVRTTSAEIEISGIRGSVEARSVSGGVEVSGDRLSGLKVATVSGGARLRGSSGSVDAETVSGALDVQMAAPQVRAKTVSGDLMLRDVSGSLEASTVSGRGVVEGGRFSRLSFSSVSGNLQFSGELERSGLYHFNSHSGDTVLRLPGGVSADFEVNSFSGRIQNDFGPAATRVSQYGPGQELRFTTGQGGARVVVKTFSGSVRLVRR